MRTHYRNKAKTSFLIINQTEKNLTNITTNPETQNLNMGQIIANGHKIYIIDALTVNQSPMTDNMNAPKSGAQRTISPLKKATQFVAASIASLTLAHADTAPVVASTTPSSQTSQKVVKADALAEYKLKVEKMTEKELRAEDKRLAEKIQPLIDANVTGAEIDSLLAHYDIVADRLEPILEMEKKKLDTEAERLTSVNKELDEALEAINEVKKLLENPEKADHKLLIEKLKKSLEIHKKYNPELYASTK